MGKKGKLVEPELECGKCGSRLLVVNTSDKASSDQTVLYFTCGYCGLHGDFGNFKWSYEKRKE